MTRIGAAPVHGTMGWQQTLERTVAGLGYELVDVERVGGGLLRVTIDRLPGAVAPGSPDEGVTVDDCELVSRQLQYLLEVEGVDYARLEVSSPGLDRALKKPADWERFVGAEVEVTLREPFQNRRKWQGRLAAGASANAWRLLLPGPEAAAKPGRPVARPAKGAAVAPALSLDFSLDEVREARLVPVIDFKRRRAAGRAAADAANTPPQAGDGAAGRHGREGATGQAAAAQAHGGQE
jgi:ribosome maturation factor RimP